jgi:hypothetical protein
MKAIQDEVKGMAEAIAEFKEKGRDYYVELFEG